MKEAVQYDEMVTKNRKRIKKLPTPAVVATTATPGNDAVHDPSDVPSSDVVISKIKTEMTPIEQLDPVAKISVLNALNKLLEVKIGSKATKEAVLRDWLDEAFTTWIKELIAKIFGSNSQTQTFTEEEVQTLKALVTNIKQRANQPKAPVARPNPQAKPLKESLDYNNPNHALIKELSKMDLLYDPDK